MERYAGNAYPPAQGRPGDLDIETLLLEGGGKINGSFLAADLVDDLSILVAPVADGSTGSPSLFDVARTRRCVRSPSCP